MKPRFAEQKAAGAIKMEGYIFLCIQMPPLEFAETRLVCSYGGTELMRLNLQNHRNS